jgi:hypothetical protein
LEAFTDNNRVFNRSDQLDNGHQVRHVYGYASHNLPLQHFGRFLQGAAD